MFWGFLEASKQVQSMEKNTLRTISYTLMTPRPPRHVTHDTGHMTFDRWEVSRPLKNEFFEGSELSFIKFCAELCTEILIKHIRFEKTLSNCDNNMKKYLFCKFCVQKSNFCADSIFKKLCFRSPGGQSVLKILASQLLRLRN